MDRRDNPEAAEHNSGEQLKEALEVILQSYKGVPPERLYREAIPCFDGLIEISYNTEDIREFAHRQHIDLKYLVDGANFVISKMHFNPEANYYITLGLSRQATQEEIRERWKRLMLLYHPDKQAGNEEWVSERAKKVNEAYSTLKDEFRRMSYDAKLKEQAYKEESARTRQIHPSPVMKSRVSSRGSSSARTSDPKWDGMKKYLPKILIGFYIVCALAVIGFIYYQNTSFNLESELTPGGQHKPPQAETQQTAEKGEQPNIVIAGLERSADRHSTFSKDINENSAGRKSSNASEGKGKDSLYISPSKKIENIPPAQDNKQPAVTGKQEASPVRNLIRSLNPLKDSSSGGIHPVRDLSLSGISPPAGQQGVIPDRSNAGQKEQDEKNLNAAKYEKQPLIKPLLPQAAYSQEKVSGKKEETGVKISGTQQSQPEEKTVAAFNMQKGPEQKMPERQEKSEARPEILPVREVKTRMSSASGADMIARDEVDEFMKKYILLYEKGDINAIMSLFSMSAIENNSLHYNDIRNAYREIFSGKINYYKLRNMEIAVHGGTASVSGTYNINRYYSNEDRWARYNGKINWKLAKENNALKIISVNYDQ